MTLEEIKAAVDAGHTVHWKNEGYVVNRSGDQWMIRFLDEDYWIGLTWRDGVTLNGKEKEFFIADPTTDSSGAEHLGDL